MGQHLELLTRLLIGTLLAAVIGYERHVHGRPAGLRTHLLVGLASTTFMLVSTQFVYFQHYTKDDLIAVDPSRIAASVVTGVGFLGGGAILRTGLNVQGLTTAAGLWLVAAIGLSAGAGMYAICVASTALGVIALTVLRRFERKEDALLSRKITLALDETAPPLPVIIAALGQRDISVAPVEYERLVDEGRVQVTLQARVSPTTSEDLLGILESQPGVRRVRIEPLP
jgi:putative Mg2+ transporter-C (MgtC) family protein